LTSQPSKTSEFLENSRVSQTSEAQTSGSQTSEFLENSEVIRRSYFSTWRLIIRLRFQTPNLLSTIMPRRETPFLPDQYYHFYNRGNNREAVFFERDNYMYFLKGIRKYLCGCVDVLAYCLMPTHYHLLVRVKPQASGIQTSEFLENSRAFQTSEVLKTSEVSSRQVSLAMQKFGISYTKAINKRFGRVGALFQGQFQGKPIQKYEHLLNLCIYIHANPVKDGLAALPEDWEYSNYLEWMELRPGTLVDRQLIQENFGSPIEYRQWVMDYITTCSLSEEVRKYLQVLED
jgi:putative transposase